MLNLSKLRGTMLVPAAMLSLLAVAPAHAARSSHFELTRDGRLVDVQVLVGNQATPLYLAPGRWDRRYFQALRGRNYALAVTNNTGRRIGVLIAVDGLNVVNGQRSSLGAGEAMYVLDPWQRTVVRGWRSSLDDVRKFVFVDEERSYAERTGQANGDLGWIRVLAFNEAGRPWYETPDRVNGGDRDRERLPYGSRESKDEPRADSGSPDAMPPVAEAQPEKRSAGKTQAREEAPSPCPAPAGATSATTRCAGCGSSPIRRPPITSCSATSTPRASGRWGSSRAAHATGCGSASAASWGSRSRPAGNPPARGRSACGIGTGRLPREGGPFVVPGVVSGRGRSCGSRACRVPRG